jgi:hypothetical protein
MTPETLLLPVAPVTSLKAQKSSQDVPSKKRYPITAESAYAPWDVDADQGENDETGRLRYQCRTRTESGVGPGRSGTPQ